jgi:hypothetical protein
MLGFGAAVDGEDLSIEVELSAIDGQPTLIGQIEPAGATTIGVQACDGEIVEVPVDDVGRFSVRPVPSGPVRLRIDHAGRPVQTTWVSYVG